MITVKTPPKDIRIASTTGHVLNLPASSTEQIPDSVVEEALARGCAIADEDFEVVEKERPVYGKEALDRKALNLVEQTIHQMIDDNKSNEWTGDGKPDAKAIGRRAKIRVTKDMRDKVWNERFPDFG